MNEIGDDSAVIRTHAGAVRIEDADDAGIDPTVAVVRHGDRLGVAFRFVVAAADADGVDVAPVRFRLRVNEGIAVHFAGAGEHELRPMSVREFEGVLRALCADHQGLDRELLVVRGAGGAGEVHHPVERCAHVGDGVADVRLDEREVRVGEEQFGVALLAADVVVDTGDGVTFVQEAFDEVAADEAGAAGDEDVQAVTPRETARGLGSSLPICSMVAWTVRGSPMTLRASMMMGVRMLRASAFQSRARYSLHSVLMMTASAWRTAACAVGASW